MAYRLERLSMWARARWLPVVAGAVVVALGGGLLLRADHRPAVAMARQSLVVRPRPFAATIDVVGVVKAGAPTELVAPFDGVVAAVGFTYGDPVTTGQMLVRMDDFEATQHVREAQAAFLKAQQAANDIATWSSSADVSRARRSQQTTELELADTQRKLKETKALLDRGLVPRSEYDSLAQQLRTQQLSATAAQEDLSGALKRGQGPNRQIAALDLESSRARLADLRSQLQAAILRAPSAGVLTRPPANAAGDAEVHVGQRLARGQLIGSIARRDTMVVEFPLNEADAGRVKPGMPAVIAGGGLGGVQLTGTVVSVAGEARPPSGPGAASSVLARVRLDSTTDKDIRIGSTANVSIAVHRAQAAIIVPIQAVVGAPPVGQVLVRDPRTGRDRPRRVIIGDTSAEGVEISSGLKAGETVVWSGG